jgi:uncharacterized protein YfaS (alpha-2-macroglobulin family)
MNHFMRILSILFMTVGLVFGGPRDAEWKKVEEAAEKDLPKTVIELLKPIETQARAEGAWAEAIRANAQRVLADAKINEGIDVIGRIKAMDQELLTAPAEMKPMMQAIQALWLWNYFSQNQGRFRGRTQTAEKPSDDIQTWDLKRILAEIDARFMKAMENRDALKSQKVTDFSMLLNKGTSPDELRPTMYDFLVHEILSFYATEEQVDAAAEDAFEFDATSPAFGTREEFLAWKPQSTDALSWKLKAIALYQEIITYHQDQLPARTHCELQRLAWAKTAVTGDGTDARMEQRLNELVKITEGNELQTLVRSKLAQLLVSLKRMKEARDIAILGRDTFPKSLYRPLCDALIGEIESKELNITTELVWNAAKPEFEVAYRNVTKVWFRMYPRTWNPERDQYYDEEYMMKIVKGAPVKQWSVDLPATDDYLTKTQSLTAPQDIPHGVYHLVCSATEDFSIKKNYLAFARVWVSDLALVSSSGNGKSSGFVLDAITGDPIKGANVVQWSNKRGKWTKSAEMVSDENGEYSFTTEKQTATIIFASRGNDQIASNQGWSYEQNRDHPNNRVYIFTDRAIYRPGQTVKFKAIAAYYDRSKNDYHTRNDESFTVTFFDANRKEISKMQLQSNDKGSFQGSFTTPTDRVLGVAYLQCGDNQTMVRIEEYKRPKFFAEVGPAKEAPKLGEKVVVVGKAVSYTGAAIDGAKVKWTVTRQAQWPEWANWCWWRFAPQANASKQIAHGSAVTKVDGTVEIEFLAEPDRDVDPTTEPIFSYTVQFDVTDTTGETRSASRAVKAGYVDRQASLSADQWLDISKPVKLKISTSTIDDLPIASKGTVAVYRLKEPDHVIRAPLTPPYGRDKPQQDPSEPNNWALGDMVQKNDFATDEKGLAETSIKLAAGQYRAVLETTDSKGKKVTALLPLMVLDVESSDFPVPVTDHFSMNSRSLEPGQEWVGVWGTGYDKGRFYYEIEHRGKILRRGWSDGSKTQATIKFAVGEEHRGGFHVRTIFVKENRYYNTDQMILVPWSNHQLSLKFESMRSKLEPGSKETWSVLVEGSEKNAVEMLGSMYDASLDAFTPHNWSTDLSQHFYYDFSRRSYATAGGLVRIQPYENEWNQAYQSTELSYRSFIDALQLQQRWGFGSDAMMERSRGGAGGLMNKAMAMPMDAMAAPASASMDAESTVASKPSNDGTSDPFSAAEPAPKVDTTTVSPRKNLQETAFFEPQLTTDEKGIVKMTFTMPEALTKWKFMGLAHDASLRSGYLEGETVTAKDLMCQPNPPRFLREGDEIEFTAKISNQSDKPQQGQARLSFADALTMESRDAALSLRNPELPFEIPAKQSMTISWRIKVPDGAGFLTFKAVASAGSISDGEEGMIPVLSRRQLVTESITLPIRNQGSRDFEMKKLLASGGSDTLKHQGVTVQVVSQPAWYAVMALPYLMEYPHECAEQTFNRYYANQLARFIVQSDPKIKRVFELWRTAPKTLESPLLKNQDLKSLMIEETPWLRDGNSETEARRNVGVLFDDNRLDSEMNRAMQRLSDLQLENGSWPWFPGGEGSDYITLYIVTGMGRLQHLGVKVDNNSALQALDWLDARIRKIYTDIKPKDRELDHYNSFIAMYLYGRSFYTAQRPIAAENQEAVNYFLKQGAKYWMNDSSLMTRCHTAIALTRFGNAEAPKEIVASLRENALNTDELGMHWRMNENYYWYQAPVETQAMIIETFREVAKDMKAVDDCQVWLLKQKQTQGWKTTKSTADAIYALLLGGDVKRLASDALVTAELGGVAVKPENVEAGTGYYEKKFMATEVKAAMGNVRLTKTDKGVSWGSLHWQYLEDVSKITPHEGNPLEIKKSLHLKRMTKAGEEIVPVTGPLTPGDEVVTRIEIRVDRDMEYIHLKSQRGSGLEPVNVLSNYKFQDGLGYYEMTKDTADHFFIEHLRRGTYVFQTSARVQLRGSYPSGIATIQSMYAPEFNSHSESFNLEIK